MPASTVPRGPVSVSALREPAVLGPGARVALVSPSGPLKGPHEIERAVATAESLGWHAVVGTHALARTGYFAGDDAQRGADLVGALLDDSIDAIWCLRGGYGAARLLPQIDHALTCMASRATPQALIGYSDITALHSAWQRAGLVSYHGPTARSALTPFTRAWFERMVVTNQSSIVLDAQGAVPVVPGVVTGRLAGGNLALIASLCGTPWAMNFRGAIVVLEDIDEATYRLDRMLTQLRLAGAFDGCAGFAFGQFSNCSDSTSDGTRALSAVVQDIADALQVPVLLGVPLGHIDDQWTLPLGALATLDVEGRTLSVHRSVPHDG